MTDRCQMNKQYQRGMKYYCPHLLYELAYCHTLSAIEEEYDIVLQWKKVVI
jgi:hypothetical protein